VSADFAVLLPIGMLFTGVALEGLLAGVLSARAKGWLAFLSGLGALAGVVAVWPEVLAGRVVDISFGRWDGPIQLAYHIDGLSFLFALMAAGIGAIVLLYSIGYMEREKATARFYALMLLFIAGLIHLVYTSDLFLIYFSWEIVGLCSFLLVGFWYRQKEAAYGARKVLTMTHLAGYGLLAAVVLLWVKTGSTLWTEPRVHSALTTGIFSLMLIAAVAKSVQFPLHTWIPDAMAAPTPVSALLHAACYVKAGVYLIARLHSMGPWPASWSAAVSWIGAVTLLVGALFSLEQRDLKRLLAFSTVSQIGYMMLGLGIGTPLAIAAGLFHCLNHGLFKGALFLCAGAVQHVTGTRDMDRLGGLGRKMPHTTAAWLIGSGGVGGIPLFNGFVSKWLLYTAALDARQPVLALIPWVGSVLTIFAFLKATSGVFLGSEGSDSEKAHEVSWTMVAGSSVLAAGCILLGIAPQLAMTYLLNPLLPAVGYAPLAGVSWFGLTAGQGMWYATAGFLLGIIAIAFGALVYWLPIPGGALAAAGGPPTVFTGGEPLSPSGHLGASDFSCIVKDNLTPFYRDFDSDRFWLWLWHKLGRAASLVAAILRIPERFPDTWLAGTAVLVGAVALFLPRGGVASGPSAVSLTPLAAGVGLAFAGLLIACAAIPDLRRFLLALAAAGALACGGLLAPAALTRTMLLEAAAAVAFFILWRTARRPAWHGYLAAVLLSACGMIAGTVAAEAGDSRWAMPLLLPGIAIKLGLIPLWFWLPLVAEWAPAIVTGLVVGVIDVAAFGELLTLRSAEPWLFTSAAPWLALGVASAVLGAVLALAQRDVGRLLAFSTITDMGFLVVAVTFGGEYGMTGALLGAAVHAMAKALLFASVAAPESEGAALINARGLASRHPLAGAGFLVGSLSILGVPPTLGYAAHWRVFSAVSENPLLFAVLAGAAMLAVAVYARAIALYWWGPDPVEAKVAIPRYSRPILGIALTLLMTVLIIGGLWPQLLAGGL
jgi:NADH:ubiquinone oxidoreductase subunit 5 (subunit L)/multisubunit Na+/H+ antiporter MnhA subunit